jgi:hypothetical protein
MREQEQPAFTRFCAWKQKRQAGIVWSLPLIIASGVKMPQGTGAGGAAGRKWDR